MSYIHTEHFSIRTSEINHLKRIHPHAFVQLMQEASMQHTIGMQVSVWDLESMNGSWVLIKMEVNFVHFPLLNEQITVHTFPSGKDGYFTFRDYSAYDKAGRICATASSQWTMMNIESRKMMKIPDAFGSLVFHTDDPLPKPDFRLPPILSDAPFIEITSGYLHLDWNGHVNNVLMVRMIMESLGNEIFYRKKLKTLKIQFKSEVVIAQRLKIAFESFEAQNIIRHAVTDISSGKDVVLAETSLENY